MVEISIRNSLIGAGLLSAALLSRQVSAHGYVVSPESRGYACKLGQNADCGAIIWEPQSLEAPKGFPQSGPADGRIASAGAAHFAPLDAQTATRWSKRNLQPGSNRFTWRFTANHSTHTWRYFITRQGWNPNLPLSRSSFDLTPFCSVEGNYRQPPMEVTHTCNVPNRSGYHVILAVWDIGDTANAFYNVIDVNVGGTGGGGTTTTWQDIGDINPLADLKPGDSVRARFFEAAGENTGLETRITINSTDEGRKATWTKLLAEAINREHTDVKAGRLDAQGTITPVSGRNDVYVLSGAGVQRVEVSIEAATNPGDGGTDNPDNGGGGGGTYDHVYPQNISSYKAGTRVLARNGKVYECKPFPYSGWCTIPAWQYEPGAGPNWQDAWIAR